MPTVRYEGGSADGLVLSGVPAGFAEEPRRELCGADPARPFELYRRRGGDGDEHVFVFDSATARSRRADPGADGADGEGEDA